MSSLFGGGGGGSPPPQYLPPPPPPPTPIVADYSKSPQSNSASLIGGQGDTNVTGGKGLDTEASTTRKSLLGD